MAKIRYIGLKDVKTDNVANTGVVWFGNGDEQDVPDSAAPALLRHTTVWELVGDEAQATKALDPITAEQLAELDDKAMHELAKAHDLKVHHKKAGDALRAAILEAQATKA